MIKWCDGLLLALCDLKRGSLAKGDDYTRSDAEAALLTSGE
jgi:hypothetical protein